MQSDVRETGVDAERHWVESADVANIVLVAADLQIEVACGFKFLRYWLFLWFVLEVDKVVLTFPGVILLG